MRITDSYRCLLHLGISPRHKGFCYLALAVMAVSDDTEDFCAGAGDIYMLLNQRCNVTRSQAERCIRYAIEQAWVDPGSPIHELFSDYDEAPKLLDFLCRLALFIDDAKERIAQ